MDQSSLAFFRSCGVPTWRELLKERGIVGTPLLEIGSRFLRAVTYGDELTVRTCVENWAAKTFRHRRLVYRGDELVRDGFEVRPFVARDPQTEKLKAIPIPPDVVALCR